MREGDVFLGANGELSTLVSTERVEFPDGIKVYNFTVDGNHDYFVIAEAGAFGQTCVLVHNGGCASAKKLARSMTEAGNFKHGNQAAHHIVPGNMAGAEDARKILKKHGIDINSNHNGVWLPRDKARRFTTLAAYHGGRHTAEYADKINKIIIAADKGGKAAVLAALQSIRRNLASGNMQL